MVVFGCVGFRRQQQRFSRISQKLLYFCHNNNNHYYNSNTATTKTRRPSSNQKPWILGLSSCTHGSRNAEGTITCTVPPLGLVRHRERYGDYPFCMDDWSKRPGEKIPAKRKEKKKQKRMLMRHASCGRFETRNLYIILLILILN